MDLIAAFEQHLRRRVSEVARPREVRLLPPIGTDRKEQQKHIFLYAKALYNAQQNQVRPLRREIVYSQEYLSNPRRNQFTSRITLLEKLLREGDAAVNDPQNRFLSNWIKPIFQTTKTKVWVFIDKLRYEWGIIHFHVENRKEEDALLFAMVDDTKAYFIDLLSHKDLHDQKLLEIAVRAWPEKFEYLHGIHGDLLTPEQVKALRNKNGNYVPAADGKAVLPKHAIMASGIPFQVVRKVDWITAHLKAIEVQLADASSDLFKNIAAKIASPEFPLDFEVIEDKDSFMTYVMLREKKNNIPVRVDFATPVR